MNEVSNAEPSLGALNALIMNGDISKLDPKQKLDYYHALCKSVGLNPLTKPLEYMKLNGKEVLYATKVAAEQIRNNKGISITSQHIEWIDDLVIVTVEGRDKDGRIDTDTGFAYILEPEEIRTGWDRANNRPIFSKNPKAGKPLAGEAKGNVLLKAITKAKRRLTLSMAGLGVLDETEVESIPTAQKIVNGEVVDNDGVITPHKSSLMLYQEPFTIKLLKRREKPDWRKWGRDYYANLKNAPIEQLEEWFDLNQENYDLLKEALPEVYDHIEDLINKRVDRHLDASIQTDMAEFKEAV